MFWPKHAKAQETVREMQGKEVGTIIVRKGSSTNDMNANDLHLVVLADSKDASMLLTNWSTAMRNIDVKKKKCDRNWYNLSAVKHKIITTMADMQSMITMTTHKVACNSKKHFHLMIGI